MNINIIIKKYSIYLKRPLKGVREQIFRQSSGITNHCKKCFYRLYKFLHYGAILQGNSEQ